MAVPAVVAVGAAASALSGCGGDGYTESGGGYGDCYCNGCCHDYYEICGAYCNYFNYGDACC